MNGVNLVILALVCLVLAVALGSGGLARILFGVGAPLAIVFFVLAGALLWRSGDWAAALTMAAFAALGAAASFAGRGRVPENVEDNALLVNFGVPSLFIVVVILLVVIVAGPQPLVGILEALR